MFLTFLAGRLIIDIALYRLEASFWLYLLFLHIWQIYFYGGLHLFPTKTRHEDDIRNTILGISLTL